MPYNIVLHSCGKPLRAVAQFLCEADALAALDGFNQYRNAGEEYCVQEVMEPGEKVQSGNEQD